MSGLLDCMAYWTAPLSSILSDLQGKLIPAIVMQYTV